MSTTSGPKTVNAQQGTIVKNAEFVHVFRKTASFDGIRHTPLFDGVVSFDTHYTAWMNEDGTLSTLAQKMIEDDRVGADIEKFGFSSRGSFSVNNMDRLLSVSDAAKDFINGNLDKIARIDRPPVSAGNESTEVGCWIAFEADHRLGMDSNYLGERNINIYAGTGGGWHILTSEGSNHGAGSISLELNQWHHVAMVRF